MSLLLTSCPRSEFHGVVESREQCEGFKSIISRSKERKIRAVGVLPEGMSRARATRLGGPEPPFHALSLTRPPVHLQAVWRKGNLRTRGARAAEEAEGQATACVARQP